MSMRKARGRARSKRTRVPLAVAVKTSRAVAAVDLGGVGAVAALHEIGVVAGIPDHAVVAGLAEHLVVAVAAGQRVVAVAAEQQVGAAAADSVSLPAPPSMVSFATAGRQSLRPNACRCRPAPLTTRCHRSPPLLERRCIVHDGPAGRQTATDVPHPSHVDDVAAIRSLTVTVSAWRRRRRCRRSCRRDRR